METQANTDLLLPVVGAVFTSDSSLKKKKNNSGCLQGMALCWDSEEPQFLLAAFETQSCPCISFQPCARTRHSVEIGDGTEFKVIDAFLLCHKVFVAEHHLNK